MCIRSSHHFPSAISDHQNAFRLISGFCSEMLYFSLILVSQIIKSQAIRFFINQRQKFVFQYQNLGCIQNAFENRILHTLSVVYTFFCYLSKSRFSSLILRRYIICNQNQQYFTSLLPQKRRILIKVSANCASQKHRLHVWNQTPRYLFTKERVRDRLFFTLLPGGQEYSAAFIIQ